MEIKRKAPRIGLVLLFLTLCISTSAMPSTETLAVDDATLFQGRIDYPLQGASGARNIALGDLNSLVRPRRLDVFTTLRIQYSCIQLIEDEMLEPYHGKLSRTVLRGEWG